VELRVRFKMTQAGMAAFLNVSEKTVESWEQGSRNPGGAVLRLLQVIADPSILEATREGSPTKRRNHTAPVTRRGQVKLGA
jgi:transcriptional regulator with XRE-family HTH domain